MFLFDTPFRVGLVTTAAQFIFTSLIDPAEPAFLGTTPWRPDRAIVIYVSCLRNANDISFLSTAG
jgi:hypothetical protein